MYIKKNSFKSSLSGLNPKQLRSEADKYIHVARLQFLNINFRVKNNVDYCEKKSSQLCTNKISCFPSEKFDLFKGLRECLSTHTSFQYKRPFLCVFKSTFANSCTMKTFALTFII